MRTRRAGGGLLGLALLALAVPATLASCGGGDDGIAATPTIQGAPTQSNSGGAAQRPSWFPARFPLPADTTVTSDAPASGGGGTAEFLAPVSLSRAITIMDQNLETASHRFTITARTADENGAAYELADQDNEFNGTVRLSPKGESQTSIVVELTPQ